MNPPDGRPHRPFELLPMATHSIHDLDRIATGIESVRICSESFDEWSHQFRTTLGRSRSERDSIGVELAACHDQVQLQAFAFFAPPAENGAAAGVPELGRQDRARFRPKVGGRDDQIVESFRLGVRELAEAVDHRPSAHPLF